MPSLDSITFQVRWELVAEVDGSFLIAVFIGKSITMMVIEEKELA